MKKYTNKAFTLVELIVVITILAILATVAFISLGGQTDNARNTVKKDSLGKLITAIDVKKTTGMGVSSFVSGTANNLTAGNIAGILMADAVTAGNAGAGDINLPALEVKTADFQDEGQSYKYGYSKYRGGRYEVAGNLKQGEFEEAYVVGNYEPRTSTSITGTVSGKQLTISASDVGQLAIKDTTGTGEVIGISSDKLVITFDAVPSATTTLSDEVAGLIGANGSLADPVTQASTTKLPY